MTYKLKGNGFENYTGQIGQVHFVNGQTDDIPDRLDVDVINTVFGLELVQVKQPAPTKAKASVEVETVEQAEETA
ncbi:hypothetical protein [Acinetobacter brisouii]|uniref:hypothetical protein n=1 Tax=Acinetobacter brisouii TaxID=396323 RepID=UPI00124E045A|nr:hypothetical protein [Acinetobacter brisouii]